MNKLIIHGPKILKDTWANDQALVILDGKIHAIIPSEMVANHLPAQQLHFPPDFYLAPGFIDLHIHGAHGADVMDCSLSGMQEISRVLAMEGVTHFLATTMTAPIDAITNVLTFLGSLPELRAAKMLGIHLEGPFISKAKLGAQPDFSLEPDLKLFYSWQKAACDRIRLVTLAPELTSANEFIKALVLQNIVVSLGHTNASYEQTCAAIKSGASQATHLFNAMSGISQRKPGAATAILLSSLVHAEIIVDGVHLHPAIVKLIYTLKKNSLLLVTDAIRAKCLGDGSYDLAGQAVRVKDSVAYINDDTLAGSTLKMPQAVRNMVEFSGCELEDALRMASTKPASILGLQTKGHIDTGMDADLVVLNNNIEVVMTLCGGEIVFHST